MPVESYTCPHCNAPLKVNSVDNTALCTYCGAQFRLKSPEEQAPSAPRRRRTAPEAKRVLQPVLTSTEDAIAYAALWMLSEPYLDIPVARTIRWDTTPTVCIAPVFYDRVTYVADYAVDVGERKTRKVNRNRSSTNENYTDWHTKSGQVHGSRQIKVWGADVSRNPLLYENGICDFRISGDLVSTLPDSMRASVVYSDSEPTEASVVKAIGSDAEEQVKQLYAHRELRYFKTMTPSYHVEERTIARLPLWHVTQTTPQTQYQTYINAVHPRDGIGDCPISKQEQGKIQKNYRWSLVELILCGALVVAAISGILNGENGAFAWPMLIAAAMEYILFRYAIHQANQHEAQHASTCEDIAEACWNDLKQMEKPIEQRWSKALDELERQKERINPSKNKKRPIIFAIALVIAVIGVAVSFRSTSSNPGTMSSPRATRSSQTNASTQVPINADTRVSTSEDGRAAFVCGQWNLCATINMDALGWPDIDVYAPIESQYLTQYVGPDKTIICNADSITINQIVYRYDTNVSARGDFMILPDPQNETFMYTSFILVDNSTMHVLSDGFYEIYHKI